MVFTVAPTSEEISRKNTAILQNLQRKSENTIAIFWNYRIIDGNLREETTELMPQSASSLLLGLTFTRGHFF
jgi:hypothetical protein